MVEITADALGYAVQVKEMSGVGEARRMGTDLARRLNFAETQAGKVALVITEAASNLVKHAGEGLVLLRALSDTQRQGIEILALDKGPGIQNITLSLRDGHSTAGSVGGGLGAMQRLADRFDIYSQAGAGTAVLGEIWSSGRDLDNNPGFQVGAVSAAYPGETVSGDSWAVLIDGSCCRILVADGLGHGQDAADAAREAVAAFRAHTTPSPVELMPLVHSNLRKTRGAAVAVAAIDREQGALSFAGIGNISGVLIHPERRQSLVSHNGIMGHQVPKFAQFSYAWSDQALLVLHSDGLGTHWSLERYPGLGEHHPSLIAGVLYRDHKRDRDDVTVLVVKSGELSR